MMILVLLTRSTKVGLLMVLLFSARFSIDALGYSVTHTSEWMAQRTYATAGALPQIGADLQDMNVQSTYLCSTGTSYAWRALSYHSYPVLLTEQNPDSVVVHKSTDFAFDGQTLRCAEDTFTASLIKTYPDDSSLYLVQ